MSRYLGRIAVWLFIALICPVSAAPPLWWTDDQNDTRIVQQGGVAENYAPANLGQLKLVAKQAKKHLDRELAAVGGAGPAIDALVASFTPVGGHTAESRADNYAPVNLGQLKRVAKPFYDRLIAVGYNTRQNLIDHGATGWAHAYAWNPATPVAENYYPATLGQLKLVFSFLGNQLPVVTLLNPIAGDLFVPGGIYSLSAAASDPDGTILKVEFYDGTTKIVESTVPSLYRVTWSHPTAGSHSLRVRAWDNQGGDTWSATVTVNILADVAGNGLPDAWEIENFGNLGQSPTADFDGDGRSNYQEFLLGTDATQGEVPDTGTISLEVFTPVR